MSIVTLPGDAKNNDEGDEEELAVPADLVVPPRPVTQRRDSQPETATPLAFSNPDEVKEAKIEEFMTEEEKKLLAEKIAMVSPEARLLFAAAEAGDVELCKEYIREVPIQERVDFVSEHDEIGMTAAFYAIFGRKTSQAYTKVKAADVTQGHVECIRLFMEFGADPNHQDDKKNTILHLACAVDKRPLIKMMLRFNADTTIENWEYRVCAQQAKTETVKSQQIGLINGELEKYKEDIKEKRVLLPSRSELSYFRSLFDVMDQVGLDMLRFQEVFPLLEAQDKTDISSTVAPPILDARKFFMAIDSDKDGQVTFEEFLLSALTYQREAERASGKGRGKKKSGKKKKK